MWSVSDSEIGGRVIRPFGDLLDGAAVCASTVCMVHCIGLPLLIAALPALAGRIAPGEWFHVAVLAFAIPTSGLALLGGWRRHRLCAPLAFGAIGLILMATGMAFADEGAMETALTVAGSLSVAGAHLVNWRARRRWTCRPS